MKSTKNSRLDYWGIHGFINSLHWETLAATGGDWGRTCTDIKVEVVALENGKGEEFRVAIWLSSGQVTVRLQGVHERILQADRYQSVERNQDNVGRFNNLFQDKFW